MYFYITEEKFFFNIILIFLNFNFLTLVIKTPIKLTQYLNYERVKKCPMDTTHFSISRQVEKSIQRNLLAFLFLDK